MLKSAVREKVTPYTEPFVITSEQKRIYNEEGYLLVRRVIPDAILDRAEAAMRRFMQTQPQPSTDSENQTILQGSVEDPALSEVYHPGFIAVAAQLAGQNPMSFEIPLHPWALVIFPQKTDWHWPEPHVDHALQEDRFKIFPRAFWIASITYLTDVPPQGGGTIVWPKSHKVLAALARREPDLYTFMSDLNGNLRTIELGKPVELKPCRGDVLFYHYLCAHSAGINTSSKPRLALGKKW